MDVRFTRHAKNNARRLGVTIEDAERVITQAQSNDRDEKGNHRYVGSIAGRRVRVVVAHDDPDLIVTIHDRRS